MGRFNAYRFEDPIAVFQDAGYVDLFDTFQGPNAYTYQLYGELGYLNHALASPALLANSLGASTWHINSDEATQFDYNDTILDTGEAGWEVRSDAEELYAANAFRTSDYDPLIVGLTMVAPVKTVSVDASGINGDAGGKITARITEGWAACGFSNAQFIPLTGEAAATAPTGIVFPSRLFDFTVANCAPGSGITVELTHPSTQPFGTTYWKYGRTTEKPTHHWYPVPDAIVSGNTVTFSITDGGFGDDDLTTNGTIVDPSGPGLRSGTSIPTLSEWALLLLAGLTGLFAVGTLRQRMRSGATTIPRTQAS